MSYGEEGRYVEGWNEPARRHARESASFAFRCSGGSLVCVAAGTGDVRHYSDRRASFCADLEAAFPGNVTLLPDTVRFRLLGLRFAATEDIVTLILDTGLPVGEALGLSRRDTHLKAGI